ncbi:MAG: pyruvate formate lyase family protein [Eubacteriales bacterium]
MANERTAFLRDQTLHVKNKSRAPFCDNAGIPSHGGSLYIRRAEAITTILDTSPVYIAERELVVGTRTLFSPNNGNDGRDVSDYNLFAMPAYINSSDIEYFGFNGQFQTKTHYTPDYGIILHKGIGGIIGHAEERLAEEESRLVALSERLDDAGKIRSCFEPQPEYNTPHDKLVAVRECLNSIEFLKSVIIVYEGISRFVRRYSGLAYDLSLTETDKTRRAELEKISGICAKISVEKPSGFYEAIQLFWFTHLAVIMESMEFISYGRLDCLLAPFCHDIAHDDALELMECLFLKMYDQADVKTSYLSRYGGQLTMSIGGVDQDGNDAVSPVTYLILEALNTVRLTEPLVAVKVNSKNPKDFLEKACALSASGLNSMSYYNDDLWIDSLALRGIPLRYARIYGFGLCQDMSIPGWDDLSGNYGFMAISHLMEFLKSDIKAETFDEFLTGFKKSCADAINGSIAYFNRTEKAHIDFRNGDCEQFFEKLKAGTIGNSFGRSLMAPFPILSALFHGCIESATDITLIGCELKNHGHYMFGSAEAVNSLAAIKTIAFDKKLCTVQDIYTACVRNYEGEEGEILRQQLWNAPKWGNDVDDADLIAKDFLEYCLTTVQSNVTGAGGVVLSGIHQPHPVATGAGLMATPEGRKAGMPVAVTMTPENGTMKNGPTAALTSAAKFDYKLINWNYCFMLSYSTALFKENKDLLEQLIRSYFKKGGLQHQPNICSVDDLRDAQLHPENYPDLIVRLWGVSVRFADISKALQDEIIQRFTSNV